MSDQFHESYVYLIAHKGEHGDVGPVKVGFTKSAPEKRMVILQTGNPTRLSLVFKFSAPTPELARLAESVFHEVAKDYRLTGEWFDMEPMEALNALTKCFMGLIAQDVDNAEDLIDLLKWSGVFRAADMWNEKSSENSSQVGPH